MDLNYSTPALLFPAVSLLMIAYTNRFLGLAALIRNLREDYSEGHKHPHIKQQLESLEKRIVLIKNMQALGTGALMTATVTMLFIYLQNQNLAKICFGLSLLFMVLSLITSLREIFASTDAIKLELGRLSKTED